MNLKELIKHTVGAGVTLAAVEWLADKYAAKAGISGVNKHKIAGAAVGCAGGGAVGYYIGEKIANHIRDYSLSEKAIATATGAAAGAVAGYALGSYLGNKVEYEVLSEVHRAENATESGPGLKTSENTTELEAKKNE